MDPALVGILGVVAALVVGLLHQRSRADLVESLAPHSVQQRLAWFLLDRAHANTDDSRGSGESRGRREVRRWTHHIAVHLGSVRDVVGRELRAMEDAGLLRTEHGRIVPISCAGLEALADR